MIQFKRIFRLSTGVGILLACGAIAAMAQAERPRLVTSSSSRPVNAPAPAAENPNRNTGYRPQLVNKIVLSGPSNQQGPSSAAARSSEIVRPSSSAPLSSMQLAFNSKLMSGIQERLGIPYNYGSTGPNYYDCSGFVWSVFNEAGLNFERSSAKTYWETFEPVSGDDQYQFGTLVFFNHLGHVGIVADKDGFYQASSSKGITYSKFEGYWEKRIVGFRRVPLGYHK